MSPDAMEDEVSPEAQRLGLDQKSHEINIFDDEFSHLRSFNDEFSWWTPHFLPPGRPFRSLFHAQVE